MCACACVRVHDHFARARRMRTACVLITACALIAARAPRVSHLHCACTSCCTHAFAACALRVHQVRDLFMRAVTDSDKVPAASPSKLHSYTLCARGGTVPLRKRLQPYLWERL